MFFLVHILLQFNLKKNYSIIYIKWHVSSATNFIIDYIEKKNVNVL